MHIRKRKELEVFTTKDSSEIREYFHPRGFQLGKYSIAEAVVHPGKKTINHYHRTSDETYYIIGGSGIMTVDGETRIVNKYDAVYMPAGSRHVIENTGKRPLKILCICDSPYSHDDTVLLG